MKVFILCALLLSLNASPTPGWYNVWQSEFNETYINNETQVSKGWTLGTYSYNWNLEGVNNYRDNGEYDLLCGSTSGHANTPCADIVNGENRYLYFPNLNKCCICCNEENGCGVLKPNWVSDAQFQQEYTVNGELVNEWLDTDDVLGGPNYYSQLASNNAPFEMFRTKLNDKVMYDTSSFTEEFSDSILELPSACNGVGNCGLPSLCVAFRAGTDFIRKYRKH